MLLLAKKKVLAQFMEDAAAFGDLTDPTVETTLCRKYPDESAQIANKKVWRWV